MLIDTHVRVPRALDQLIIAEATRRHLSKNALVTSVLARAFQGDTGRGEMLADRLRALERRLDHLDQTHQTQLQGLQAQLTTLQCTVQSLASLVEESFAHLDRRR